MKIISKDLRDGEKLPERHVFNGMGYQGDNISPHLAWDEVPAGTKSFVVTCYDPEAARHRQKGKPTAISSRCTRWTWRKLRSTKGRAARW
ncbi:MAG: kinase inhibitor protein [Enterobacter mori]|nr:kinase inhibitor protein [Enterobacter mori]